MSRNSQQVEIRELAQEIMHHKKLYYGGKPEISDVVYDALEARLRSIAPHHPALNFIGADPAAVAEKVEHAIPMLSLEKTYEPKDLETWAENRELMAMLKIDGNSLSLVYKGGKLDLAKTRGNGRVGERVTEKAVWVSDIPTDIGIDANIEVRGELFCTESSFVKIVAEFHDLGLERPTSPRNIVAGLLGRKTHYNLARYFNFFAFDFFVLDAGEAIVSSEVEKFKILQKMGFSLPDPLLCKSFGDVEDYLARAKQVMEEGEIGVDGVVFSFNDLRLHAELGNTAHHPRYKLSFKWQGQTAVTEIESITWYTSRFGVVTPVAVVKPVFLSGATINNVTLHNAAHVKEFELKPGDRIEIVRSGEVIPKFLQIIEQIPGQCITPERCADCDSALDFDGVRLICPNRESCPAQLLGGILNWIRSVEIEDLSEKRLLQLKEANLVKSIPDLYKLTKEDFLKLPQTKEKMAGKLLRNIQKSKNTPLARFLNGLGINGTGPTTWEKLIEHFGGLEDIRALEKEQIISVDGFAEKSAGQITDGLKEKSDLIEALLKVGVAPAHQKVAKNKDAPLFGKQIVVTGTLSVPREEIESLIKQAGAKITSSVSKNTFAVVTEDPSSNSSKMQKARQLGLTIWSEKDLRSALDR